MSFDPQFAERRFGVGLSPNLAPPRSVADMLDALTKPDEMAARFPIQTVEQMWPVLHELNTLRKLRNRMRGTGKEKATSTAYSTARQKLRDTENLFLINSLQRCIHGPNGFLERLTLFWADHFTAAPKQTGLRRMWDAYVEQAIRPNIAASFGEMLRAVITNPAMLAYLDQQISAGPSTRAGQRRGRGLNENLAREVLELHTLGVGGAYSQTDVRQLAELFTGLSYKELGGFYFRDAWAEPGAETVLGKTYGHDGRQDIEPILAFLDDIGRHPQTARHLCTKLAVHFVSDSPPIALIEEMTAAYRENDGALLPVYGVMLNHPDAWGATPQNFKQPFDFISSSLRALGPEDSTLSTLTAGRAQVYLKGPLTIMGQQWRAPLGPDGFTEDDDEWITPQGMAGRITWALKVPQALKPDLPDPRAFLDVALGDRVPEALRFAVSGAETVADGVALTLISPAFQRR